MGEVPCTFCESEWRIFNRGMGEMSYVLLYTLCMCTCGDFHWNRNWARHTHHGHIGHLPLRVHLCRDLLH